MKTVLIIDDSILIRTQLKEFFTKKLSYKVVDLAKDGNLGVSMYKQYQPDLVTLDIAMPNKDGLETLDEIIQMDSDARVLIISANKDKHKITQALDKGAVGYISKPLQFNTPQWVKSFIDDVQEAFKD